MFKKYSPIKDAAKRVVVPVARAYFALKASWFFSRIATAPARRLYRSHQGGRSLVRHEIATSLARDGIARTSLDALFPGENLLPKLQEYVTKLSLVAETKTNKLFLKQLWDALPELDLENPCIARAIDRKVLDPVNDYLGSAALFSYATLNITMPVPEGAEALQSQRWHRDPDDRRMCKLFIYLNDVDEGSGPFIYVKGSQLGGKYGHLFPQQPPRGSYPDRALVEAAVNPRDIVVCTARAGTVLFADTAGLHRGGYATKGERLMFTAGYYSRAASAAWPFRFQYPAEFKTQKSRITDPLVQHALTNPHTARSVAIAERLRSLAG